MEEQIIEQNLYKNLLNSALYANSFAHSQSKWPFYSYVT